MNSLETYQEVDSYWYDRVPSYWKKTKNKYVFYQDKHFVGEDWEKFTLLTMGKSGVKPRDMDGGGKFPASFETYQTVEPDQLIFCLFDLDETPRTIGMSKDYGMITSAYDVFSTTEGNDPQFWTYFYQMIDDHKGLRPFYTGLRKVVRSETFMGIEVFSPPLEEQKLISRYLDKKTEQIDRLVKKIKGKIELLKEQRSSLINQCVTKGLDPNVEMKDSDVEWIGEIPKHWSLSKLKYEGEFISGHSFDSDAFTGNGEIRSVKISNIQNNGMVWEDLSFLPIEYWDQFREFRILKGDLLFVLTRPIISSGIKVTFYNEEYKSLLNQRNSIFRATETSLVKDYLFFVVRTQFFLNEFKSQLKETGQPNISTGQISNIRICIPPVSEQSKISQILSKKNNDFELLIKHEQTKIDLLKEYRQSLISSVVTGKVRVMEDMI